MWPPLEALRQRRVLMPIDLALGRDPMIEAVAEQLRGKRMFWNSFRPLVIPALETDEAKLVIGEGFWCVAFYGIGTAAGLADNGGSFRAQLLDWGIRPDHKDQRRFQSKGKGLNQPNSVMLAQAPHLWRVPFYLGPGHPIGVRVQNRAAAANTVNVALFGYAHDVAQSP